MSDRLSGDPSSDPHDGAPRTDGGDPERTPDPTMSDALAAAARKSGLGRLAPGEAPTGTALLGAMGGIRGLVESILPGVVFLVLYTALKSVVSNQLLVPISVLAPGVVALVFIAVRLIQRQSATTAVAGLFGIIISAILAIITGRAENSFIPGFIIDAVLALVMIVSLVARRPLIGVVFGLLLGGAEGWRDDPRRYRVAWIATILWAAFPLARLAVQLPLFLAQLTTALGATKLVMGVPLYAGVVWVTWLLMRSTWTAAPTDADASEDV